MIAERIVPVVTAIKATEDNYEEMLAAFEATASTFSYLGAQNIQEATAKAKDANPAGFVIKFPDTKFPTSVTYSAGNIVVYDEIPLVYQNETEFKREYNIVER